MTRIGEFFEYFSDRRETFIQFLMKLAQMQTPSGEKSLLDAFANEFLKEMKPLCDGHQVFEGEIGPTLLFEKGSGEKTVLILGHMDTVWPVDFENKPPLKREGDLLRGPGVLDMKGGLAMMHAFLTLCRNFDIEPDKRVIFLINPDEEIGSHSSREIIEEVAKGVDGVLVLEPALADRSMKIRRKGVGEFKIAVYGKEAHSGINPQEGINAIHEAAPLVGKINQLNDYSKGTTVNVNTIRGGTARNVIPGKVEFVVDFRAETLAEARRVEGAIQSLKPENFEAEIEIKGGMDRPPMEDCPESNRMADMARKLGLEVGLDLDRKLTGGGSDGNFTAALGIPTLDGLGLDGAGAHTPDEHISLETIPARCALLAELILKV